MKRILKVQKQIGVLSKKSENPFFKSAYLDLNDLLNAVKPLLEDEGLILMQPLKGNCVHTVIIDSENGDGLAESYMEIPASITDPQKIGSCITYLRRYTLKSLLAIAEQDDDGNEAAKVDIAWLTKEQYESALKSDLKGVTATLNKYSKMPFKMSKEYKDELDDRFKVLSTQE